MTTCPPPEETTWPPDHCHHLDEAAGCCFCGITAEACVSDSCMDIHTWFGLTYSNYLVLHRTILQSMPMAWQVKFVAMLRDLEFAAADLDFPSTYTVSARNHGGKFIKDPIPHYNRGRERVELRDVS